MTERKVKMPSPDGNGIIEGTEVQIAESVERWSEFTLEDGTIVRAKQVMTSAVRIDGQYDAEGRPIYVARGAPMIVVVSVPENLLKKSTPNA